MPWSQCIKPLKKKNFFVHMLYSHIFMAIKNHLFIMCICLILWVLHIKLSTLRCHKLRLISIITIHKIRLYSATAHHPSFQQHYLWPPQAWTALVFKKICSNWWDDRKAEGWLHTSFTLGLNSDTGDETGEKEENRKKKARGSGGAWLWPASQHLWPSSSPPVST